jgi:uncharacterized membrane protein
MELSEHFGSSDIAALAFFILAWAVYAYVMDASPLRTKTLSFIMDQRRVEWMEVMSNRNLRMVDTAIISGLQQGTAFFASTAILAIGGCFAMLSSSDVVLRFYEDLPFGSGTTRTAWEIKIVGLAMIFAYAFFKFGWSYRLFNYCSIAIGAVPEPGDNQHLRAERTRRAAELNQLAGKHFNAGLRAIFLSIGFMGWFAGPLAFVLATAFIVAVLVRRQFFSRARQAAGR